MSLPLGFRYASVYAGIRKTKKNDLALIFSDEKGTTAAAVFTRNRVKAAPVLAAQANLKASGGCVRAVLVNAGNANCATRTGAKVVRQTTAALARLLKVPANRIFPASTGVIGVELDPAKIVNALPALVAGLDGEKFDHAANAIMTTDLVPKSISAGLDVGGQTVHIAGFTKGSGMIAPNMATTLGFVMTDAAISARSLLPILRRATARSYNRITVDGDQSTNDCVLVMASGASKVALAGKRLVIFEAALTAVLQELAIQIVRDGEGAKKLVTIEVTGAQDEAAAAAIGKSIANSPLVKTAIAGADPNWGRIICAAGYSGVEFDPAKVEISFQGVPVCKKGLAVDFDEAGLGAKLEGTEVNIDFRIAGPGSGRATFWTCDLTHGYIDINGSYRT